MPKRNAKPTTRKSRHDRYELPEQVDFSKTRFVGLGFNSLKQVASGKRRTVELEPDVAEEFGNAAEVNAALRLVKQLREDGRKRSKNLKRKSA